MERELKRKIDYKDKKILGIHHITAITGNLQQNIEFYTGILGLRLVKVTVNFDDPSTYHLYYGDELGRPGTILTFFAWPNVPKGHRGSEQVTTVSFSIPRGSIDYWKKRLADNGIDFKGPDARFSDEVITLFDPDDLRLELVAMVENDERNGWTGGPVPTDAAIKGLAGATLSEREFIASNKMLTQILGFLPDSEAGNRYRYRMGDGPGYLIDLEYEPTMRRGLIAGGTVHHLAFRAPNEIIQQAWRTIIAQEGFNVTPVRDRKYFCSIYFREPGGILFEIATDGPGFTIDENPDQLGGSLMLPSWLETDRAKIESVLPPLNLKHTNQGS